MYNYSLSRIRNYGGLSSSTLKISSNYNNSHTIIYSSSLRFSTNTTTKPTKKHIPSVPWGLISRYAKRLPIKAYPTLPEFSAIGILNRPSWYEDADINNKPSIQTNTTFQTNNNTNEQNSSSSSSANLLNIIPTNIGPQAEARAYVDALHTPRDEYIIELMAKVSLEDTNTSSSSSSSSSKLYNTTNSITGGRRISRKRSNSAIVTPPSSSSSSTTTNTSTSSTTTNTAEDMDTLLLSIPPQRDQNLPPLDKTIQELIKNSIDVFTLLFSSGLPYVHRPYNQDTDESMFHPTILTRLREISNHSATSSSTENTTTNTKPTVTIKKVKAARVIDTWSVWDSATGSSDNDITIPVDAIVRELGHSVTIEIPENSDNSSSSSSGLQGILIRFLNKFFHFYQLKPVKQVQSQITIAYLCEEEHNNISVGEPLVTSDSTKENVPKYTIHTITYEAQAKIAYETSIDILRYILPQTLSIVNGWRIIDIDGHFGPNKVGYPELSFGPLIPRARSMSWRRAGLELRDALSDIQEWCPTFQHISETSELYRNNILKLQTILQRTPGGKEMLSRKLERYNNHSLQNVFSPLIGILLNLQEASIDIADVQNNRPPWVKRTAVEIAYDKNLIKLNTDDSTIAKPSEAEESKIDTEESKPEEEIEAKNNEKMSVYQITKELTTLTASVSPIFGSISKNDPAYKYAQYGMHIQAVKDFLTRTNTSQQWIIAAYEAVRNRVGSSMGELHSRRLDTDIMYQIGSRGTILILPVLLRLIEKYVTRLPIEDEQKVKESGEEKEQDTKETTISTETVSEPSTAESTSESTSVSPSNLREELETKIIFIAASVATLQNMRIGGPVGSLFRMEDTPENDDSDDEENDDDKDHDTDDSKKTNNKNDTKPATKVSNDAKLSVAEKEARKLDPARADRIAFRNAVHEVYQDIFNLLELLDKHHLLDIPLSKEELDNLRNKNNKKQNRKIMKTKDGEDDEDDDIPAKK